MIHVINPMCTCTHIGKDRECPSKCQLWLYVGRSNLVNIYFLLLICVLNIFFVMFIFYRERESVSGGGQRERGRIRSRLQAVRAEPNVGLELTNCEIMT